MHYLVSVIADGTELATPGEMAAINAFNDNRLKAEGQWVFAGGLASPSTATVVDNWDGEPVFTDGPFRKALRRSCSRDPWKSSRQSPRGV